MSGIKKLLETIKTAEDFRACAHALEAEAVERYSELADQMEVHNNREVASLFRRMAEIEALHVKRVKGDGAVPAKTNTMVRWLGSDSAEAIQPTDLHYLMTPHHALSLALKGEENAAAMFEALAAQATDPEIKALASEMAEEEREHVKLVKAWLAKYPEPDEDWHDDPDPPTITE